MIDIVLPLAKSKNDFLDLRYFLRSVERHVRNYNEIVIVGSKPSWIQGVIHIPYSEATDKKWKEKNIMNRVLAACIDRRVTDDFFFCNDDFVFLDKVDAVKYPYYYSGTCKNSYDNNFGNPYRKTMYHTMTFLESRGYTDRNFDAHCPIIYNKKKFLSTFDDRDINFETPFGYGVKTLYASCNRVKGVPFEDCKFQKSYPKEYLLDRMKGRHVISFNDHPLKTDLGDLLKEMYPQKSSYEK